ncbi:MAG: VTC domain-containing protein [Pirellulales bacterium]
MAFQGWQARRFELKYVVDEAKAKAIRPFLLGRLEPDAYNGSGEDVGYSVRSLYLDTPTFLLKRQTDEGHKNRFKLRIRFYDDKPESPAFLEIKRRENDIIRKERALVTRTAVEQVLAGRRPDLSELIHHEARSVSAFENFFNLCCRIGAAGSVFVVYRREAYVSPSSDDLRVTFDRQIESRRYTPGNGLQMPNKSVATDVKGVVLEIKFTDRFPYWTRELAYMFNLNRTSVPKYVECVEAEKRTGMPLVLEQGFAS